VNDQFTHAMGDRVLVVVAELLRRTCRPEDTLVRLGGEEFGVVLRRAVPEAAHRACERLRHAIASHDWAGMAPGLQVTGSIGLVTASTPADAAALLARADALLYDAKHAGRDRVCVEAAA
jgi:diguanylate cyclase (GGDEF)-like protein